MPKAIPPKSLDKSLWGHRFGLATRACQVNLRGKEAQQTWIRDAACSIRGAKDAPKYKDYILPLIFAKRLCDVFDDELNRIAAEGGGQSAGQPELSGDSQSKIARRASAARQFHTPPDPQVPGTLPGILFCFRQRDDRRPTEVNTAMVEAYWLIGRRIVNEEQRGQAKAAYRERLLEEFSRHLDDQFGKGFSVANLRNFRQFYLTYSDEEANRRACPKGRINSAALSTSKP